MHDYLRCRADTELELEAEGLRQENEEFEKRNRRTKSLKELPPASHLSIAQPRLPHFRESNYDSTHAQQSSSFKSMRQSIQQAGNVAINAESIQEDDPNGGDENYQAQKMKAIMRSNTVESSLPQAQPPVDDQKRGDRSRCLKFTKTTFFRNSNRVLDLNQAIENQEELEQKLALRQEMAQTSKALHAVLKNASNLSFVDKNKSYMSHEYEPINLDLLTLQIVLSKLLNELLMLRGGNLTLYDVMNFNKMTQPLEV